MTPQMLKLLLLPIILPVFFALVIYKLKSRLPSWEGFRDEVASFTKVGADTSHVTRSIDMEAEFKVPWRQWDPQAIENCVFDPPTLRTPSTRRYFGPMDMEVAGDQISIYDMELGHVEGIHVTGKIFQTVISIKPPELRLPPFIVRPKSIKNGEAFSRERVIKSGSLLDVRFSLETLIPHRTKALFQSAYGTEVLIPFLNDRKWTAQWTGNSLIVYQWNRLIDPEHLHEVALEVSEFFELLKSGPEVIDRKMEELIQQTAQRTNSNSAIGLKTR